MAGRAEPGAQSDARASLVRLGHLSFDDFLLLDPYVIASPLNLQPSGLADWSLALNNAPDLFLRFRRLFPDSSLNLQPLSLTDITAAQSRLVHAFAYNLLRAKAPPLYDSLPWHDWDFSIVARRFKLWQTRFLLAGDGTTVMMCRCRKSAGVYVLEPCKAIARYVERKAALERIRRFKLLRAGLDRIPLPDRSTDLAVIGSIQEGLTASALAELTRVAANVLLVENSPLCPPLAEVPMTDAGFRPDTVEVSGLGPRRCWWKRV
jgi:hypothetical protein